MYPINKDSTLTAAFSIFYLSLTPPPPPPGAMWSEYAILIQNSCMNGISWHAHIARESGYSAAWSKILVQMLHMDLSGQVTTSFFAKTESFCLLIYALSLHCAWYGNRIIHVGDKTSIHSAHSDCQRDHWRTKSNILVFIYKLKQDSCCPCWILV